MNLKQRAWAAVDDLEYTLNTSTALEDIVAYMEEVDSDGLFTSIDDIAGLLQVEIDGEEAPSEVLAKCVVELRDRI